MTPPKATGTVFRIRADGKITDFIPSNITEAQAAANGLFAQGYKAVEIIDEISGSVVERLLPPREPLIAFAPNIQMMQYLDAPSALRHNGVMCDM